MAQGGGFCAGAHRPSPSVRCWGKACGGLAQLNSFSKSRWTGVAVKRSWIWGASVAVVISALMVVSPLGQAILQQVGTEIASETMILGASFSEIFPSAKLVGAPAASTTVDVGLAVPVRDPARLSNFLQESSTPGSPEYRHFLTSSQFLDSYAPTAASYAHLTSYFAPYGVTVQTSGNRLMLNVMGSPAAVGAAFHTQFKSYQMPNGQVFFGPTTPPEMPSGYDVSGAYGFTNALYNTPAQLLNSPVPAHPTLPSASCPNGDGSTTGFTPTQIADAYGENTLFSASHNGAGMTVGIVDSYDSAETQSQLGSDLTTFSSDCGLPAPTVHYAYPVQFSGYNSSASSSWGGEEVLDMDWVHATARGATVEMTFSPNSGNGLYAAVDYLVSNKVVNTISLSWGEPDVGIYGGIACSFQCNASTDGSYAVLHPIIEAADAEGISVFVASGDCGAMDGSSVRSTDYPASDEGATGVGGTLLTMSGTTYVSETAWSDTSNNSGANCQNQGGAGGGYAPTPEPWYQSGTGTPSNGHRGVPDVGITAGSWLDVVQGGSLTMSAGTSDAAPQWAGLTAIADQIHSGDVGLINPALYAMLHASTYSTSYFHDITTGNNGYSATAGWDPITGVGTPRAQNAIPFIAGAGYDVTPNGLNVTLSPSVTSGSPGLSVTFTAAASGASTFSLYCFYFGDGNATTTSSNKATHTYPTAGTYAADVVAYDSVGNSTESFFVLVSVGTTPFSLSLSASSTSPAAGASVTFTATPTGGTSPYTYQYNFGDGSSAGNTSSATSTHTFAHSGVYCAQATATDSKSPVAGAASNVVTLNVGGATGTCPTPGASPGPTISAFTATPNPVTVGSSTSIAVSVTGGTAPLSYAYTGLPSSCSTQNLSTLSCTPTSTGSFTVKVTVTDAAKKSNSSSLTLTVSPSAGGGPTITSFSASPSSVTAGSSTTFTVTASGGTTPYTFAYTSLPSPCTSVNATTLPCTPSTAGSYTVGVTVTDAAHRSNSTTTVLTVTPATGLGPTVSSFSATVNPVPVNTATTLQVTTTGGSGGNSYAYSGLPSGCGSQNTASLPCTPTSTGTFSVVVTVTDSASKTGTGTMQLQVNSSAGGKLAISSVTYSPSPAIQGSVVTITTTTTGGKTPLAFAYAGLPAGCTGVTGNPVTCVPSASGSFSVTVTVTDSSSPAQTTSQILSLTVNPATAGSPTVTLVIQPTSSVTLGSTVYFVASPSGGTSPYSYSYPQLPTGCTGQNVANLSCLPTAAGTFTVVVTVTDAHSLSSSASASLTVTQGSNAHPVVTAFNASGPITVGQSTTFTVVVQGGTLPYHYVYTGLPTGCTSSDTASLSCAPTASGTFTVTVTVTDAQQHSGSASYTLVVNPANQNTFLGQSLTDWLLIGALVAVIVIAVLVLMISRRHKRSGQGVPPPEAWQAPRPLAPWDEGGHGPSAPTQSWNGPGPGSNLPHDGTPPPVGPSL